MELGERRLTARDLMVIAVMHLALQIELVLLHELTEIQCHLLCRAGADVGSDIRKIVCAETPHASDEPLLLLGGPRRHMRSDGTHDLNLGKTGRGWGRGGGDIARSDRARLGIGDCRQEDQILMKALLIISTLDKLSNRLIFNNSRD